MATLRQGDTAPDFLQEFRSGPLQFHQWASDGDEVVILPTLQDPAEIAQRFPRRCKAVNPCLRLTPQPNK